MFQAITNDAEGRLLIWHLPLPHVRECTAFGIVEGDNPRTVRSIVQELEEILRQKKDAQFDSVVLRLDRILSSNVPKDYSFLLALGIHDTVSFFARGNILPYLINATTGSKEFSISPIEIPSGPVEVTSALQFVSGKLNGGRIIFLGGSLDQAIPPVEALDLILQKQNGLWSLKQAIAKTHPALPFGVVVWGKGNFLSGSVSEASMKQLLSTAKRTEKVLEAPLRHVGIPRFMDWCRQQNAKTQSLFYSTKATTRRALKELKDGYQRRVRPSPFKEIPPEISLESIPEPIIHESTPHRFQDTLDRMSSWWRSSEDSMGGQEDMNVQRSTTNAVSFVERFNRLPFRIKVTGLVLVIALFAFTESILALNYFRSVASIKLAYESRLDQIEQTIVNAQGNIIYRNEAESRSLITQASEELKNLESTPPRGIPVASYKNRREELNKKIIEVTDALSHRIMVDTGSSLGSASGTAFASPVGIFISSSNLYIWNHNQLGRWNAQKQSWDTVALSGISTFENIFSDPVTGNIAIDQGNSYVEWNLKKGQAVRSGPIPVPSPRLALYNHRLYLASAKVGILRLNGKQWQPWLKDTLEIRDASPFAIDGDLYVYTGGNLITRFRAGKKTNQLSPIADPPIQNLNDLTTTPDSKYLYLFDSSSSRLIVVTKEGALVAQYLPKGDMRFTGAAIDEKNKKIYFIVDQKIVPTSASHLEK